MDFRTNLILKKYMFPPEHYRIFSDEIDYSTSSFAPQVEEFFRVVSLYKESYVARIFSSFSNLHNSSLYKTYELLSQINFFKDEGDWVALQAIEYLNPHKKILLNNIIKTFKDIKSMDDPQRKRCIDLILKKLINNKNHASQDINTAICLFGEYWPVIDGYESLLIDKLFDVENRAENHSVRLVNALISIMKFDMHFEPLLKTLSSPFLPEMMFKLLSKMDEKGLLDGDESKITLEALITAPLAYRLKDMSMGKH